MYVSGSRAAVTLVFAMLITAGVAFTNGMAPPGIKNPRTWGRILYLTGWAVMLIHLAQSAPSTESQSLRTVGVALSGVTIVASITALIYGSPGASKWASISFIAGWLMLGATAAPSPASNGARILGVGGAALVATSMSHRFGYNHWFTVNNGCNGLALYMLGWVMVATSSGMVQPQ